MMSATTSTFETTWPACDWCRRPAEPADWKHNKQDRNKTVICPRCVSLALCRMAIIRHGALGDKPQSARHQGHERRLEAHEKRIFALEAS